MASSNPKANTSLEDKLNQEVVEYIANSCQNDVRFIKFLDNYNWGNS